MVLSPAGGMTAAVCAAVGVSRATVHRARAVLTTPPVLSLPRSRPARALTEPQQKTVLDVLHAPRFADQAPAEIYATLLDEGVYHCSIRTMYRILDRHGEISERRRQLRHPVYQKPELLAERPNEVWSWDITKLMGPAKWSYFYLYVILDIYSRRVVGWCVADAESATLFQPLFDDAIEKHNVPPGQLTLHADRGAPMISAALPETLRLHRGRQKLLPSVLRLVQPGPSPCRDRPHDPGPGALRSDRRRPRRPADHARSGVPRISGALRQQSPNTTRQTNRHMDQSTHAKSRLNAGHGLFEVTARPRAFLRPGIVSVTTVSAAFRFEGCPHCVPLRNATRTHAR